MQHNRPFSPTNPQRPGILPPLSKYYYGPAVSPDRSPAPDADAGWTASNLQQGAPALPPRPLPNSASAPPLSQWSLHQNGMPPQSRLPGPSPTAPSAHPVAQSAYNPNTYGPMPGARLSPINATWNQSTPSVFNADISKWGVNYNHVRAQKSRTDLKPPLPPRPPSSQSQHNLLSHATEAQHPHENDSFEYLRPVAYSPVPSPSISQSFPSPNDAQSQTTSPQHEPQRQPPSPPRKIPIYDERHQIQDPSAVPNQPHALRGSEGSVVDDRLSERKPSTRGPSLGTTENHLGNDSPNTGQDVGAQGNHRDHATGQEISIGDAWSFSYSEDENRGESSFSRVQVQNEQQPLEPRQESIAPSAYDEVPTSNSGNNQAQHDDSFYWHSPHSSASVSHDRDQNLDVPGTSSLLDATPEPQDQYVAAPTPTKEPIDTSEQTAKLYQSTTGPYSASALGFGGPSDWEHFGDYDGEEVDDTDLYIRPRSPVKPKASPDTSELPGDTTPTDVQPELHPPMVEDMIKTTSGIQRIPSGPIPLSEPQTNEVYHHDILKGNSAEKSEHQMQPTASDQQDLMSFSTVERGASIERQLASKSTSMTHLPQFPFEQEQQESTSSEDVVNKVNLNGRSGPMESLIRPGPSIAKNQYEDAPAAEATEMQSGDPAVTNVEWMTERNTAHSDSMVHNDVQQPLDEQFDTQSERENKPRLENGETATGGHEMSRENSTRRGSLVSEGIVLSKVKDFSNPYVDLDPWGKASLNRYVAMLHEEARAPTETEKLNMFRAFIRKEWKLRAILYGADDEQVNDLPLASKDTPVSRTNTLQFRRPASKALPALPPDADQPEVGATKSKSPVSLEMHKPSLAKLITTPKEGPSPRSSGVESHVMIDTPGEQRQQHFEGDTSESYSPGGRPIQFQAKTARRPINPSGPIVNKSNIDASPDNTEEQVSDKKPAYIPFRYSQGYIDDSEQPVDRRASFRPYAALKLEPIKSRPESAPEFVAETSRRSSLPATADSRHVNGSSSSTQAQFHPKRNAANAKSRTSSATDHGPPLDLRRFERADFDPLIAVLPLSGQIPNYAVELPDFQHGIDAVPDDFNFIHQHVVAWDTKAKKIRAENERERQIRQGESDQRIDALFNDDEIGYGDISELESEFKRAEAARKKDEDRAEYQSFVEEVFNAVWTRLHYEIDQLSPLYDRYSSLANETLAGKDMFEATRSQYALAPTLTALLTLHQKLEIRHQKALESVLERDRRLKKTEVAPLYTLGNVAKVKQIEKQFESAERKAIAEYCKQRNARANRLMDVLDQNTLRGVGANQDYMEAVMKAVRRIASGRAFASVPASEPGLGMDEVMKAKAVTATLAASSEQIVQTFHVADMLLNAADFELSVATARLANAESTTFERLKEERAKEEGKLMRNLQHRLALIREDSRRTNDEIVKLLCFLGVQGGHAEAGNIPRSPPIANPEHEQRLQKALEDAKRRNAPRAAGEGLP